MDIFGILIGRGFFATGVHAWVSYNDVLTEVKKECDCTNELRIYDADKKQLFGRADSPCTDLDGLLLK